MWSTGFSTLDNLNAKLGGRTCDSATSFRVEDRGGTGRCSMASPGKRKGHMQVRSLRGGRSFKVERIHGFNGGLEPIRMLRRLLLERA